LAAAWMNHHHKTTQHRTQRP